MQVGVNVLGLSSENSTQIIFAKELIGALQIQQPDWQFVWFAKPKQSVFFKKLAIKITSPPALMKGQWLQKKWLKNYLKVYENVSHLINIGPGLLIDVSQPQWVILFEKAAEQQAGFFQQKKIHPIAVWPQVQLATSPVLPQSSVPICGIGVSSRYFALDWHQRLDAKDEFTQGAEYFFYDAEGVSLKTIIKVLKAFSQFKKRQKTGLKLVIHSDNDKLQASLQQYKFRSDVIIDLPLKAHPQMVSAAYAVIFTKEKNTPLLPLVQALNAEKALICWPKSVCEPIVGEAALYAESTEPNDLAIHLMQLYTNEQKLMDLQHYARQKMADYNWQHVATVVAEALLKV